MERPKNSVDLFDLSAKYGSLKEDPAKIIFHQVHQVLGCRMLGVVYLLFPTFNELIKYKFFIEKSYLWLFKYFSQFSNFFSRSWKSARTCPSPPSSTGTSKTKTSWSTPKPSKSNWSISAAPPSSTRIGSTPPSLALQNSSRQKFSKKTATGPSQVQFGA